MSRLGGPDAFAVPFLKEIAIGAVRLEVRGARHFRGRAGFFSE